MDSISFMGANEKYNMVIDEIERMVYGYKDKEGNVIYYSKAEIKELAFDRVTVYT